MDGNATVGCVARVVRESALVVGRLMIVELDFMRVGQVARQDSVIKPASSSRSPR